MGGYELWVLCGALGISVVGHVLQWIWYADERDARKRAEVALDLLRADNWRRFRDDCAKVAKR